MANAFAGQALMDIGKGLPGMFRTNRQTEEEKRLNEIRKKMMEEELMASEVDRAFKTQEEGRKKSAFDIQNEIGNLMKPVDTALPEGIEGPQLPERFAPGMDLGAALSKTGAASVVDQPGVKGLFDLASKGKGEGKDGLFTGWKTKANERDAIVSGTNPYTKEPIATDEEKNAAWDMWEKTWATSTALGITPKYVEGAANKAATIAEATIPAKAATATATTTATEQAQRDIQKTNPMLTGEGSIKLAQSAMGIKNLYALRNQLASGNVEYFDIVKGTGQFKDPKVNNAFQQVSEIVGRQQSGAAIGEKEWNAFGKEILNKNFLLTEQGRKTALENLDDYLDRFQSVGILQTSDVDWYKKYLDRAKQARQSSGGEAVPTASTFTDEKRRRLEELRAKKAAGTIGK